MYSSQKTIYIYIIYIYHDECRKSAIVPIRANDSGRDLQLARQRPPRLAHELLGMPMPSTPIIIFAILVRPYRIPIPISPFCLKQPPVVIKLARLRVHCGLLHHRQPPLELSTGPWRRKGEGMRRLAVRVGNHLLPFCYFVGLLASGAEAAAALHRIGEALRANLEVALAGDDIVAMLVLHELGITALDGAC